MKAVSRALLAAVLVATFGGAHVTSAQDSVIACADIINGDAYYKPETGRVWADIYLEGGSCPLLPYNMLVYDDQEDGYPDVFATALGTGADKITVELFLDDPPDAVCVAVTSGPHVRLPIGTGWLDTSITFDRGPDEGCFVAPPPPLPPCELPPPECPEGGPRGFN